METIVIEKDKFNFSGFHDAIAKFMEEQLGTDPEGMDYKMDGGKWIICEECKTVDKKAGVLSGRMTV